MLKITVCIGSCCHAKGAGKIVEMLQHLIAKANLKDKIDLAGKFCMGTCEQGVCVSLADKNYSLSLDTVQDFFDKDVLPLVK